MNEEGRNAGGEFEIGSLPAFLVSSFNPALIRAEIRVIRVPSFYPLPAGIAPNSSSICLPRFGSVMWMYAA